MKKIVVLLASIFLITGCSVKYNIIINEDLSLAEEASLTGTPDFFAKYYKTTKINVIKSYLDIYETILEENNYKYELKEDSTPYVDVKKTYKSVSDFTENSILFNDYFDEVKYSENGNIKKLETIGYREVNPDDNEDRFYVSELEISIKCPYKVVNHNAKKVDKKTNTYYYDLVQDEKLLLEYDTSSKYNPNSELIRTLLICLIAVIGIWITVVYLIKKNK